MKWIIYYNIRDWIRREDSENNNTVRNKLRYSLYFLQCEKDALMKPKETKTNVFQDDEMVLENYMIENASFYLSFEEIDKTAASLPDDVLVIPINELAATDMSDKTENTQFQNTCIVIVVFVFFVIINRYCLHISCKSQLIST